MRTELRDFVKITPRYLCIFSRGYSTRSQNWHPPVIHKSKGYLSHKSIMRIKLMIDYFLYLSKSKHLYMRRTRENFKYRIALITLTLSATQLHSDEMIKKFMLAPFMRVLKNRFKVKNYIWKAEVQDNGNLHFHITIDEFIAWQEIRKEWNSIQNVLNYIDRSRVSNPNSTDIHAVKNIKNLSSYIANYLSKKDEVKKNSKVEIDTKHYYNDYNNMIAIDLKTKSEICMKRPVFGKIWDCNNELKKIKCIEQLEDPYIRDEVENESKKSERVFEDSYIKIVMRRKGSSRCPGELKSSFDKSIIDAYSNKIV